jgi:hypothetical protein
MIEIGIGVLFAILFVSAYLLVKKLLGGGDSVQRWRELGNHPLGNSRRVTAKPPQLFLKTGELSEHHSKTGRSDK